MGAGQSTASQLPARGLHVLRVTPSSPASETSIEPYFDFIVGYKGDSLTPSHVVDATELEKIVESHEGRSMDLIVWNGKNKNTRVVPIIPSREWSLPHIQLPDPQNPDAERKPSLLGLAMRMCNPETSLDNVWHVLDVLEGSPAESAGLVPYGDWIIGWPGSVLGSEGDFYDVVEAHIEKPLRVYVYSYDFDTIREVVLVPNRHWGGEGLLGCVFGFGLLHRIPPVPENREPGSIPAELMHPEDEYEEQQLFVPADYADDMETPEEAEERMRWEQEEWEREAYARSYMHNSAAANHIPSAYVDSAESEQDSISESGSHSHHSLEESPHGGDGDSTTTSDEDQPTDSEDATSEKGSLPATRTEEELVPSTPKPVEIVAPIPRPLQLAAPTPVRPASFRQSSTESPMATARSPSFSFRSSTPTPTRPFGSMINGIGISPRTPSWDARASPFELNRRDSLPRSATLVETRPRNHDLDDDDDDSDDNDDAYSAAGTEATDVSEATSHGSLTSVD